MALYTSGTLVTVTGTFTNLEGALTDPTTVTMTYAPAGSATVTTVTPSRVSMGIYTANIDTTGFGAVEVAYEFDGTGACQASGKASFWTQPSLLGVA